ncbi:hypothetical protein ARMGADRAFT_946594 [Armillaria gallica]|uniref:Uncharacterized protein n=1 Tax=Armillaria gallica TaxID=47427 RepID=A0A2H3D4P0_ARMGA|nr:hypothetical protein ARMGADRAFT_946594 [Armillaria gallica]
MKWEVWFSSLMTYFEDYELGKRWKDTLGCWSVWEGRGGFVDLKGAKYSLSVTGHPEEVGVWIKNYQRIKPEITSIRTFADAWWTWWKCLQPEWRGAGDGKGEMGCEY